MTIYTRPDDLPAFAESGDVVQPTNPEIQTGWPLSTVPPSRQRFNWILNFVSNAVRYFMQRGVAEWSTTEDYPLAGRVQHAGVTWVAILANTGIEPGTDPLTWERWAYSDTDFQPRVDKITAFTVTTADVTLTAEQAKAGILNVTGLLTGNRNIIIPNTARRFIVLNGTTGAFTLGVKTASGVAVLAGQGGASSVVCDGNNNIKLASADLTAYAPIASPTFTGNPAAPTPAQFDNDTSLATTAFVQRALGNLAGITSYTATQLLSAALAGRLINFNTAASVVCTLPPSAGMSPSSGFWIINTGNQTVTVSPSAGDLLFQLGSALNTSIALGGGDSVYVIMVGGGQWYAISGTGSLKNTSAFGSSLSPSGYQKLPSGLIIQWGVSASVAIGTNNAITFPIAFPNAVTTVTYMSNSLGNSNPAQQAGASSKTTAGFNLWAYHSTTGTYNWMAIGY